MNENKEITFCCSKGMAGELNWLLGSQLGCALPAINIIEVPERMRADGGEHYPLDLETLLVQLREAAKQGLKPQSLLVALMHAEHYPANEQQVAAMAHELGFESVLLGSTLGQSSHWATLTKLLTPLIDLKVVSLPQENQLQGFVTDWQTEPTWLEQHYPVLIERSLLNGRRHERHFRLLEPVTLEATETLLQSTQVAVLSQAKNLRLIKQSGSLQLEQNEVLILSVNKS